MLRLALTLALAPVALGAHAACGAGLPNSGLQRLPSDAGELVFAPTPAPLPLGRHFALDIALCGPEGLPLDGRLQVDADMPAHRHGMNYQPTVRALGQGRYRAEGLLLHMPGQWRLRFSWAPLAPAASSPMTTGAATALPLRWQHLLTL